MKLNLTLFAVGILAITITSCHKDQKVVPNLYPTNKAGIYVMNTGNVGGNNTTVSFYDYTTKQLVSDIFSQFNGLNLQGNASSIGNYGSRFYVLLSYGLRVVNAKTTNLIKTDSIGPGQSFTFYKNNILINTGGTGNIGVMDTASYQISKTINTGNGTVVQMKIVNNKLYALNAGATSSFVSVIDLNTFSINKTINIDGTGTSLTADTLGHIYVGSQLSGGTVPGEVTVIDDNADVVKSLLNFYVGGTIYYQNGYIYYPASGGKIITYNIVSQTFGQSNFIIDGTILSNPYAISGNPDTGELFVSDIKDGRSNGVVYAFDKTGTKEYSIPVGINPFQILLISK